MPSISIVIPAFNAQSTLLATLHSVQGQTLTDWECIVVDDGSTDETRVIAESVAADDPRMKVLHQANGGVSAARNAGIAAAKGEWIHLLDSDDRIEPPHLAALFRAARLHDRADVIYCDWRLVSPDGAAGPRRHVNVTYDPVGTFAGQCAIVTHAAITRRTLILEAGGFDTGLALCEDWDLWQRLARMGAVMRRTPDTLVSYYVRPGSVSSDMGGFLRSALEVIRRGHSDDPRLAGRKLAAPLWPSTEAEVVSGFALWLAGRAIGAGQDAAELLAAGGVALHRDFDPATAAQVLLDGIMQGAALAAADWQRDWPRFAPGVRAFLERIEGQLNHADFAILTLRAAEGLMLAAIGGNAAVGGTAQRVFDLDRRGGGVWLPRGTDRLIGLVTQGGKARGSFRIAASLRIGAPRIAAILADFAHDDDDDATSDPFDPLNRADWDRLATAARPAPDGSPYEATKLRQTLDAVAGRPLRALVLGGADRPLVRALAGRVGQLTAAEISPLAATRAREGLADLVNVEVSDLHWLDAPLPGGMDLILASEMLYHAGDHDRLALLADRAAEALAPGGRLVLAHSYLAGDLGRDTGFDWPHPFGAGYIGVAFGRAKGLELVEDRSSAMYRIMVYARRDPSRAAPAVAPVALKAAEPLPGGLAAQFDWGKTVPAAYRTRAPGVPILMYHRITDDASGPLDRYATTPANFTAQMEWVRSQGFTAIDAETFAEASWEGQALPDRPIVVTFDDGYRDNLDHAVPVLRRLGIPATIFIPTDHVGGTAAWDKSYGTPAPLMTWAELAGIRAAGIGLSSHGCSHRPMTALTVRELLREAKRSRAALRRNAGADTRTLAYPYGIHDETVERALVDAGYRAGFNTIDAAYRAGGRIMAVPRIEVRGDMDLAAFAAAVKAA